MECRQKFKVARPAPISQTYHRNAPRQIAQTCDAKIFRPVPGTGQKAALQHRHAKQHETQSLRARKSEQVDLFTAQQDEAMEHKDGIATLMERSEERRVGKGG